MIMPIRKTIALLLLLLMPLNGAYASSGVTVIRDTEIEETIRDWTDPILRAAGLNPKAVDLVLVQSPEINAFVAGGSNIFLYTGLIAAAKEPGELLGVIAHETGHIAGGHLIRGREARDRASYESILASILGIGAAALGGAEAGGAIMRGGHGAAIGSYLSHSRTQESSADQAALKYLEAAGYNPQGMVTFLGTMQDQELLPASQQNPYVRSHPMTRDRIDAMRAGTARSAFLDTPYPPQWVEAFNRIRAKLIGYIEPQRVTWLYSDNDQSITALYAQAIAAYRRSDKVRAQSLINRLIALEPDNPYFHELKGQMLRDFGGLQGAAQSYRKAIALKPDAALIRIDLAQVLIEQAGKGNPGLYKEAEAQLKQAQVQESRSPNVHRLFATLYGRQGDEGRARYHLAEGAAMQGRSDEARGLLKAAMGALKPGDPSYRQAMDLKLYLDSLPKKDTKQR